MHITAEFANTFESVPRGEKTSINTEYNETVENFKVLITLIHRDLDVNKMKLIFNGKTLRDEERLNEIPLKEGDIVKVARKKMSCGWPFLCIS